MHSTYYLSKKPFSGIRIRLFQISISITLLSLAGFYYYTIYNPFTNGIYWKAMGLFPPTFLIALILVSNPNILTNKDRTSGYAKDPPITLISLMFFIFSGLIIVRSIVDSDTIAFEIASEMILHGFIVSVVLLLIIIVNSTTEYLNNLDMK